MASYYVYSGAGGTGTGADWANAYITLTAAVAGKVAGDIFYVAHDHAESTASAVTITFPGTVTTAANLCYCVDRAGSVPPVAADLRTTGSAVTTGASNLTINGHVYVYGMTFSAGTGAVSADLNIGGTQGKQRFDNCVLALGTTNARTIVFGATTGAWVELVGTTMSFAAATQTVSARGNLIWKNTASALAGAQVPSTLFTGNASNGLVLLEGVDLSAAGSGKTLVGTTQLAPVYLKDCKLGGSVTIAARQGNNLNIAVYTIRSDSANTNYRHEKIGHYCGDQIVETTIVRTGGASDGATPIAWKITTTANSKWIQPFECIPISVWNETTGSLVTLTVEGIWGGGAVPNNDDIWIDVEYLGSSTFPSGSFATSGKASNLASNAALSSSSEIWGGSTTKFKMTASFTPQKKGPITVYVRAAAISSIFYICPKVSIS